MEVLKTLRLKAGLTQAEVAEPMGVVQQTYGRWERGVDEPSMAHLRELAILFSTSVDYLLGRSEQEREPSHGWYFLEDQDDAFWGHLGIKLPLEKNTRWWPITAQTWAMARNASQSNWIALPTLANRLLIFQTNCIEYMCLLDDACDEPDDWELGFTPYQGLPVEQYKAIKAWAEAKLGYSDDYEETCSTIMREAVEAYLSEEKLLDSPEEVLAMAQNTKISLRSGGDRSYWVEPRNLDWLCSFMDGEGSWLADDNASIELSHVDGELEVFYPLSQVAMIEVPLAELSPEAMVE